MNQGLLYKIYIIFTIFLLWSCFLDDNNKPRTGIHGIVYDKNTGNLLSGVLISSSDGSTTATSDSLGTFQFTGVTAKDYLLIATLTGYISDTISLTLQQGMDTTLNFVLSTSNIIATDEVTHLVVPVSGTPFDPTASNRTWGDEARWRYGQGMKTSVSVQSDGTLNIAWSDTKDAPSTLYLTRLNDDRSKIGNDLTLATDLDPDYFGGFTNIGTSKLAYTYVSSSNREQLIFRITDPNGIVQFQTIVIGDGELETPGPISKQSPLAAASSRVAYSAASDRIVLYFGHKQKWDDDIKHQGGFLKFYNTVGEEVGTNKRGDNGWLYSHNFDQRIKADGADFVLIGHGDAYPRAIPIRTIDAEGKSNQNQEFFTITGSTGDNTTNTQLGDVIVLNNGAGYAVTLASEEGRATRDVALYVFDKNLTLTASRWITSYTGTEGEYAFNVKTAPYGNNILIAWELVKADDRQNTAASYVTIVDPAGNSVRDPVELTGIRFNISDDFFNYTNGDVGWVVGSGNSLKVSRFKL